MGFPEIVKAENYVISHHLADVISQSFGATEQTFPTAQSLLDLRSRVRRGGPGRRHGARVLRRLTARPTATPRTARYVYLHRVTSWPASDPLVTSVGGLQYFLDAKGNQTKPADGVERHRAARRARPPAAVASRSSSPGRRTRTPWPARAGNHRGVPDISLSAAVDGGAIVYFSADDASVPERAAGFHIIGGTSEASPDVRRRRRDRAQRPATAWVCINSAIYRLNARHASGIVDITTAPTP